MPNTWDIYRHLKFLPTHIFIFSSVIMQFLYMRRTIPKCVHLRVQSQKSGTLWDFNLELGRDQCQELRHKCGAWQLNALSSELQCFSPRLGFEEPPHIESRGLRVEAVWGVETTWKVDILDGAPRWMSIEAGSHCPAFSTDWRPCSSLSCSSLTNFLLSLLQENICFA